MTSACHCDFDSQTAYLIKKSDEIPKKTVTILQYLDDKKLQEKVKSEKLFLVCSVGNELIKYKSDTRKSHFKHKNCCSVNTMTQWHREWQNCFDNTEVSIGTRYADAVVNDKHVLEFQYSPISKENVTGRMKNYKNYNVYWIIECDNCVEIDDNYITFTRDLWKYERFVDVDFIYLNHKDQILRVKPSSVRSNMVDINACITKKEFINGIKDDTLTWNENVSETGKIYLNQRGAGSGKTYESIQLIDKDDRFKNKEIFIYLTKMHTAKEVIYCELKEQYDRNDLSNLKWKSDKFAKQYLIECDNIITGKNIKIYIGTIDSFTYAITNKTTVDSDYFVGLIKDIKAEKITEIKGGKVKKNGNIQYARSSVKLNSKCLIVIDEAQDLNKNYIEAFNKIIKYTGIDVYVIGDKLQSIFSENNVFTYLESNNITQKIDKAPVTNCVKRFHNTHFKDFVNRIINFEEYGLPKIEDICTDTECKYKPHSEEIPYKIFEMEKIYANDCNMPKIENAANKIIKYVDNEVTENHYVPENFMFIFPIMYKNILAAELESRLQEYWINKFKDPNYIKHLDPNGWWKNRLDNKYHQYVVFHKSEEGKPINLKQSKHSTKILSIHASKGNGCEVVFALGISEKSLVLFSKKKCNLVYESMLNVAVTRQKISLYVGIEQNGDDIYTRFNRVSKIKYDDDILPTIYHITQRIEWNKIASYTKNDNEQFQLIEHEIIKPQKLDDLVPRCDDKDDTIVDWGHHIIRYSVMYYNIMANLTQYKSYSDRDQFRTIINKIAKYKIQSYNSKQYYQCLSDINNKDINKKDKTIIPILKLDVEKKSIYQQYHDILHNFVKNIQLKIRKNLPQLCPLESVILLYMISITKDGRYSVITIMDVYNIMYCYDECSNAIDNNHSKKCLCKKVFSQKQNGDEDEYEYIRKSITNHYENVNNVKSMCTDYLEQVNKLDSSTFKYNIYHSVYYGHKSRNFNMRNKFDIICHSSQYVIYFIIRPQFNKLNLYDVIFDIIFNNLLIKKCEQQCTDNYKKLHNKKVIAFVFTFDSLKPIKVDINIDVHEQILKNAVKQYIINIFSPNHPLMYNFYQYMCKTKPDNTDSIEHTLQQLESYDKLPGYYRDFFINLRDELEKADESDNESDISCIIEILNNKNLFVNKLNNRLEKEIDRYLVMREKRTYY